jgi:hypothetical protein
MFALERLGDQDRPVTVAVMLKLGTLKPSGRR